MAEALMPSVGSGRYSPGPGIESSWKKGFDQEIRTAMAVCSLIAPGNRAKVSIILQKSGQAVEVGAGLDEADDGHQRLGIDERVERYVRQVELS